MFKKTLWVLLIGSALVTFLPSIFPDFWLTDLMSHFRVQYAIVLSLLILLFFVFHRKKLPIIISVVLLFWNLKDIYPLYFSPDVDAKTSTERISILSINLLSSNTNTEAVLSLINDKDPDVIVFLELTPRWEKELNDVFKNYPYKTSEVRTDNFGIAMLSKSKMESSLTNFKNSIKASIVGKFNFSEEPLTIIATHPLPPISPETFELRNSQLRDLAESRNDYSDNLVIVGDLNTSSFSRHFKDLLKVGSLVDSRNGFGVGTTWPADLYILRTTLDHCLVSKGIKVLEQAPQRNIGSDHLPIYVELSL